MVWTAGQAEELARSRGNDDLGHLVGDEVLKGITHTLAQNIHEVDAAGRYGGDEFIILLSDPQPPDTSNVAGERLARAIRAAGKVDDTHHVTASVGVAIAQESDTADTLLARADAKVYEAKRAGGDRVVGP